MATSTTQPHNLYALLIGVDYYFPNRLPDGGTYPSLGGCVRDVRHVEAHLRDRLGHRRRPPAHAEHQQLHRRPTVRTA